MASLQEPQVAPETARDGFDTRKQDLNVACDDTQEMAYEEDEWEEEPVDGMCQQCVEVEATRRFWHLRNGEFWLCEDCFLCCADHEDSYGEGFLTKEACVALKYEGRK